MGCQINHENWRNVQPPPRRARMHAHAPGDITLPKLRSFPRTARVPTIVKRANSSTPLTSVAKHE
jgi:hypothetical protein